MEGLLHEDSPFHLSWPLAAYQSFCTKTPLPPPLAGSGLKESRKRTTHPFPHPETARIKGYPEQHFQHTQMDAERLNQLEARLENLGQRLEDLRGYL